MQDSGKAAARRRARILFIVLSFMPFYMAIHLGLYLLPLWVRGVRVDGTVVAVQRYVHHYRHSSGTYYTWTPRVDYTSPNGHKYWVSMEGKTKYVVGEKVRLLVDPADSGRHIRAVIDTPFNDWGRVVMWLGYGVCFIMMLGFTS